MSRDALKDSTVTFALRVGGYSGLLISVIAGCLAGNADGKFGGPVLTQSDGILTWYGMFLAACIPSHLAALVAAEKLRRDNSDGHGLPPEWLALGFIITNLLTPLCPLSIWLLRRMNARGEAASRNRFPRN